ncbi:DNA-binding MarR family transcriptional regulator [Cryobacterium sp. CAN_C3]|uniref:MarR family winged helix-turn-helix transcriptional regulator n=1 Tax=unclassified Cryobacterium TaxID=2649013 RepID=UPI0018C960B9|nr:MarR family transcriptional regulator [Cryobacterium sp. CAN_C3]MEC5155377.1 DNA-binding MarR family transcriptional regulator [Cryobacterium sp. CAN_C3]
MTARGRLDRVAAVLEAVIVLSGAMAAERRIPFEGRGLTRTQLQALYVVAHDRRPVTPGRLANSLGVTPGAVTQLIEGLRSENLVHTVANPDDARSRFIKLTSAAAAAVTGFEADTVERLLPLFDVLTDTELAAAATALTQIVEHS